MPKTPQKQRSGIFTGPNRMAHHSADRIMSQELLPTRRADSPPIRGFIHASMPLHISTKFGRVFAVVATLRIWIPLTRRPSMAANVAIR